MTADIIHHLLLYEYTNLVVKLRTSPLFAVGCLINNGLIVSVPFGSAYGLEGYVCFHLFRSDLISLTYCEFVSTLFQGELSLNCMSNVISRMRCCVVAPARQRGNEMSRD